MFLFEWHSSHSGQTHVKVGFVENLMVDGIRTQFVNHTEKRGLIGHTDDDAGGGYSVLGVRQTTGNLEGCVVGLDKLLRDGDILSHENVKVRVILNLRHCL